MNFTLMLLVIAAAAVLVMVALFKKGTTKGGGYPYQKAGTLFTPAERSFMGVLKLAVGDKAMVLGKVRVADVLVTKPGLARGLRQQAFNKISAKHFDFVLCNPKDLSILCAIELDDSSHQLRQRQARDLFLKQACTAADLPLIQVPAKAGYVIDEVKQLLTQHLEERQPTSPAPQPAPAVKPIETIAAATAVGALAATVPTVNEKCCPKCDSPMVQRVATKGVHAGHSFWACSGFPKCRHFEPVET